MFEIKRGGNFEKKTKNKINKFTKKKTLENFFMGGNSNRRTS